MPQKRFDPFADRLARDIRNALSTSLMHCLQTMDLAPAREAAEKFLAAAPSAIYIEYIDDRLARYAHAIKIIKEFSVADHLRRALVFWDQGLFFEVHEILEEVWLEAVGNRRRALQGLIRAAGTYVHLERGNEKTAAKMAAKAKTALLENRMALADDFPLDPLLAGLDHLEKNPPKLLLG